MGLSGVGSHWYADVSFSAGQTDDIESFSSPCFGKDDEMTVLPTNDGTLVIIWASVKFIHD